jgi:hypothetical protein
MATDATTQLIQRILNQLPPGGAAAVQSGTSLLSQIDSIVGNAAGYAQILSTVAGPIAQAAVANQLGAIAAQQAAAPILAGAGAQFSAVAAGATPEAAATAATTASNAETVAAQSAGATAAALAGAETAGIAAAAVLIVSFILAALSASSSSGSSQSQQITQLLQAIKNTAAAAYWQGKRMGLQNAWDSPTGGLGTDLDNLASQGPRGINVLTDVTHFHDNASEFVNIFIRGYGLDWQDYWGLPVDQTQSFSAQQVVYPSPDAPVDPDTGIPVSTGSIMGWYGISNGNLPQPEAGPAGGSSQAADPRTMLPFLLVGIESYLSIQAALYVINPRQPQYEFSKFLAEYNRDLKNYASFIYSQYQLAVNGIVKTDLPSDDDVTSYFWFQVQVVYQASIDNASGYFGSDAIQETTGSWAYRGFEWNGAYGVVDVYPQYGVYQPAPPVPVPYAAPSYIIDVFDTSNLVAEVTDIFSYDYKQNDALAWILGWVQAKLILGRAARWKAIYLLNGYDKVWSILQKLRILSNQPLLDPTTQTLNQDNTIANGNWSALELCTILNDGDNPYSNLNAAVTANLNSNVYEGLTTTVEFASGTLVSGYSLFALVVALDTIANGNWAGPGNPPSRPLSFRDRLAPAAV